MPFHVFGWMDGWNLAQAQKIPQFTRRRLARRVVYVRVVCISTPVSPALRRRAASNVALYIERARVNASTRVQAGHDATSGVRRRSGRAAGWRKCRSEQKSPQFPAPTARCANAHAPTERRNQRRCRRRRPLTHALRAAIIQDARSRASCSAQRAHSTLLGHAPSELLTLCYALSRSFSALARRPCSPRLAAAPSTLTAQRAVRAIFSTKKDSPRLSQGLSFVQVWLVLTASPSPSARRRREPGSARPRRSGWRGRAWPPSPRSERRTPGSA